MCRIAGMFHSGQPVRETEQVVRQMCDIQQHGGPDDEGLFTSPDGKLVLGNRRLALIDLSSEGHMPMRYGDRYVITYNGELYNFRELRKELEQRGHRFSNHTDTEVILASFAEWGIRSFERLQGMFAFALLDQAEGQLYMVRDPSGIKTVYYQATSQFLVFASELRACKAVSQCRETNPNWPVYMMAYGHLPEPVTTLKNVQPLPKGCFLKFGMGDCQYSVQSYRHYSFSQAIVDPQEARQAIARELEESVRRHLVADAPLGVFLSGGLDSSILTLLAAKYKKQDLNTLSIYFSETGYSEKQYQDLVIEKTGCQRHQFHLQEKDFHQSFPSILEAMDLPSCDGINTWFISQYAAALGLKAVLSGVGGDELFGGYPSFRRMKTARLLQQIPPGFNKLSSAIPSRPFSRMSYLRLGGVKGLYLFLRGHFTVPEISHYLDISEKQVWTILQEHPSLMPAEDSLDPGNLASWMECNLYMQNQLLRDSDVMSMIHSVEIRVPFLDDNLVQLAFGIGSSAKLYGDRPKQVLIDTFRHELPEAVWNRPKMGFSFPFQSWMKSSEYVKDHMLGSGGAMQQAFQQFTQGKMHWSHMMGLVIMKNRGVLTQG